MCTFGEIVNGEININDAGRIVDSEWIRTEKMRPNVNLDFFIIMPNHFHGIIVLNNERMKDTSRGTLHVPSSTQRDTPKETFGQPKSGSLPTIIRLFKAATTRRINHSMGKTGAVWQRGYYERVIRNEPDLETIRQYILENPVRWEEDENFPGMF